MRIIPAIDLLDGKCVRLSRGRFENPTVYTHRPLDFARQLEDNGMRYLHLVDLDGARSGKMLHVHILEDIATYTNLKVDFSGGIQTEAELKRVFDAGAEQVTLGSVAVSQPGHFHRWLWRYGPEKIILAADCRNRQLVVRGWQTTLALEVMDYIRSREQKGLRYAMVTDTDKDGLLSGPSLELYREILARCQVSLIASGGVSTLSDIEALKEVGCEAVIVGKALYEGRLTLKEISRIC